MIRDKNLVPEGKEKTLKIQQTGISNASVTQAYKTEIMADYLISVSRYSYHFSTIYIQNKVLIIFLGFHWSTGNTDHQCPQTPIHGDLPCSFL